MFSYKSETLQVFQKLPGQRNPRGHCVHLMTASWAEKVPGGHGKGSQWPSRGQYVPN